jgi:hypothetical protein
LAASVADQDIEAAKSFDGLRNQFPAKRLVTEIAGYRHPDPALRLDQLDHFSASGSSLGK